MLVSVEELGQSELYPEIINKITRGDMSDAELQIATAEDMVRSYMSRYDRLAIFGNATTAPTVESLTIKKIIKSIASWFLVKKANPNINTELFYDDYKTAIKWLQQLQAGEVNPELPYAPSVENQTSETTVFSTSLPKQNNFF